MNVRLIPGHGYYANSYIAGSVLIDAGVTPVAIEPFREQITHIVLTHSHFDHIAYLRPVADFTGADIYIHPSDAPGLISDRESLSLNFGAHAPGIKADHLLSDGDIVDRWTVIHTPGHTTGSICLYDPETCTLISGDTVFTDGAFGRFDLPGGSQKMLEGSLQRLHEIDVKGLYPGHGIPVDSGGSYHISAALQMIRMYG